MRIPMVLRIAGRTCHDLLSAKFLVIWLLFPVAAWVMTGIQFSRSTWRVQDQRTIFWNLDRYWQEDYNEHLDWSKELGSEEFSNFHQAKDKSWLRETYFSRHIKLLTSINVKWAIWLLPMTVLIISSLYLNRLFYHGELTLYLVRPLDAGQLFFGRFFGLFFFFSIMIAAADMLMTAGGIGADWRESLPILLVNFQTKISILFGLLAVPFAIAPLVGNFFRVRGTLILSMTTVAFSWLLNPESSLGFYFGFIYYCYQWILDPELKVTAKVLFVFYEIFTFPIPRILNARWFPVFIYEHPNDDRFLVWCRQELPLYVFDRSYLWWWSFGSGLVVMLIALVSWIRREHE